MYVKVCELHETTVVVAKQPFRNCLGERTPKEMLRNCRIDL